MTYVVADGPPDIAATHTWAPAAGTAPPVLNDQGPGAPDEEAWIALLGIDGWRDMPETLPSSDGRSAGEGEIPYPARMLGKTVVYKLQARAPTLEAADGLISRCLAGFGLSYSVEGEMTVVPFAVIGGPTWTFAARLLLLTPEGRPTLLRGVYNPYRRGFTLSLRMSDPWFYTGGDGYL